MACQRCQPIEQQHGFYSMASDSNGGNNSKNIRMHINNHQESHTRIAYTNYKWQNAKSTLILETPRWHGTQAQHHNIDEWTLHDIYSKQHNKTKVFLNM